MFSTLWNRTIGNKKPRLLQSAPKETVNMTVRQMLSLASLAAAEAMIAQLEFAVSGGARDHVDLNFTPERTA